MFPDNKYLYINCSCRHPEHQIRFTYYPEFYGEEVEDSDVFQLEVFLTDGGFWQRLKTGIKYIFGHKSDFGHFDEILIGKSETAELQQFLTSVTKTPE